LSSKPFPDLNVKTGVLGTAPVRADSSDQTGGPNDIRSIPMKHIRIAAITFSAFAAMVVTAAAQQVSHSYDANHPVTVEGSILNSTFEDPNATIAVKGKDKIWTVTLAPTSRLIERGVQAEVIAVGKKISAYGHPSTVEMNEMRADRITVDGKTYELR
jgi:Family of unknown function (DUF6152)